VIMNVTGSNRSVLTSQSANGNPSSGGDGKQIFFNSTRDLNTEVYSMALDGSAQTRLTNNAASDALPSVQRLIRPETIGVYRPSLGLWLLRTANTTGAPNFFVTFGGEPGDLPFTGDWNGDGRTDLGIFNNGTFRRGVIVTSLGQTFVV